MHFKLAAAAGVTALFSGLLAYSLSKGPTAEIEEWRGPVVLNRTPPEAPRSGLTWDVSLTAEPVRSAATLPPTTPCDAAQSRNGEAAKTETAPVADPYAG
jgi:hypothetical protein